MFHYLKKFADEVDDEASVTVAAGGAAVEEGHAVRRAHDDVEDIIPVEDDRVVADVRERITEAKMESNGAPPRREAAAPASSASAADERKTAAAASTAAMEAAGANLRPPPPISMCLLVLDRCLYIYVL